MQDAVGGGGEIDLARRVVQDGEAEQDGVGTQVGRDLLGPLDGDDGLVLEMLVQLVKKGGLDALETIEIDVHEAEAALVLIFEDERGAGDVGLHVKAHGETLDEGGLPSAKKPFEKE